MAEPITVGPVVHAFLRHQPASSGGRALWTDGTHLDSYGFPIAWHTPDGKTHTTPHLHRLTDPLQRAAYSFVLVSLDLRALRRHEVSRHAPV